MTVDQVDDLLNRRSGVLGLSGMGDMREVVAAAAQGDQGARLALDVYAHRLRHYIGAYLAVLGGADALVFTAGVGENGPEVRAAALDGLSGLGLELDAAANALRTPGPRRISPAGARIDVLVIPTDEEFQIARETAAVLAPEDLRH
jgi:acetate kinase